MSPSTHYKSGSKSTGDAIFTLKLIVSIQELVDGTGGTINHKVLHSVSLSDLREPEICGVASDVAGL